MAAKSQNQSTEHPRWSDERGQVIGSHFGTSTGNYVGGYRRLQRPTFPSLEGRDRLPKSGPAEMDVGAIVSGPIPPKQRRLENSPKRFYSMSAQIRIERKGYYGTQQATQKGKLDITDWLRWFLASLDHAFEGAETVLENIIRKARFWEVLAQESLNDRQRAMLNHLLDGFEGKLTSSKWAIITKTSQDTPSRDINDLIARNILRKDEAAGRSTSYSLASIA